MPWIRRHPIWSTLAGVVGVLTVLGLLWVRARMEGPFRDYRADAAFTSSSESGDGSGLRVGVGVREITPKLDAYDPWRDVDGNSKFEPEKGDTWEDRNGNGTFDFVWLGGFGMNRPAQGVQDPLWARALAFQHRDTVVALVSIDCVGLTHERFIEARLELAAAVPQLRYVAFSSTHTHNSPDTMGIWSYRPIPSKFDTAYVAWVMRQAQEAVKEAVSRLQPVTVSLASADLPPEGFVRDSRMPLVYDRRLCAARIVRAGTDETVATLVSWGNHPEAMGGDNPLVSSDFPHFLREGMEKGLEGEGGMKGFGGVCVFVQGSVGGLMTPLGLDVPDRNGRDVHKTNGPPKTRALGENLALKTGALLRGPEVATMTNSRISVVTRSVFAPIEGTFKYPIMLGLIHPGWFDGSARTEVGAMRVGDLEILLLPGEVYPEMVDGGVEAPEGGDFPGPPLEVPPLRQRMKGAVNVVANLANDEIGYMVPRTQWDTEAPFTYGRKSAPYGEVNSGGPGVAPGVHRQALEVLEELHRLAEKR